MYELTSMAWLHESHIHHDLGFSSQIVGEYPSTLMALPHLGHESLTFVTLYWVGSVFKVGIVPADGTKTGVLEDNDK